MHRSDCAVLLFALTALIHFSVTNSWCNEAPTYLHFCFVKQLNENLKTQELTNISSPVCVWHNQW